MHYRPSDGEEAGHLDATLASDEEASAASKRGVPMIPELENITHRGIKSETTNQGALA
jgi:hypothetical protein